MALEGVQFGRVAELIVGQKVATSNALITPPFSKIFKTRIKFDIEKDDGSLTNKSKISALKGSKSSW